MPTLTAEAHVAEALTGVADQIDASAATEVIVGDGGSHDRTREIAASFPFARVLEESDEGIHLGLNQGIEAATGDVVGFLNADDWLAVGGLNTVRGTFALNSELDFASGGVSFRGTGSSNRICVCRNPISIAGLLFGVPAINGRYFKQELLQRIGPLAPTVGLDADREFLMRLALLGANGTPLDDCTYCYRFDVEISRYPSQQFTNLQRVIKKRVDSVVAEADAEAPLDEEPLGFLALDRLEVRGGTVRFLMPAGSDPAYTTVPSPDGEGRLSQFVFEQIELELENGVLDSS